MKMPLSDLEDIALHEHVIAMTPVGSRVTCNPPPTSTDEDYLVLVDGSLGNWERFIADMVASTWKFGGSIGNDNLMCARRYVPMDEKFASFKLDADGDTVNIIATPSHQFHRRFLAASSVCKRLNLLVKADRIAVFQAVLYGNATP